MPQYLFQWVYKDTAIRAVVEKPHDRYAQLKKAVEGFGGELQQFFYAFGEWDGFAVVEFPNAESCAACSMTLAANGANASFKTTVLIAPDDAWRAMRRASEVDTGYVSPVGYGSQIEVDGKAYETEHRFLGAQIKALAGKPPGDLLYCLEERRRTEVGDAEVVQLHQHERFVTQSQVGGGS
jgi:uncharacterized protein with GYD domain